MNCVKCGAELPEGSTTTLCAACQALETPPQDLGAEPTTPPADPAPTPEAPAEEPTVEPMPPTTEPPVEPQENPDENQPMSGIQ